MSKFKPGDKVRTLEVVEDEVPAGSMGTVEKPSYQGSPYVRVTFSQKHSHVPYLHRELELAE